MGQRRDFIKKVASLAGVWGGASLFNELLASSYSINNKSVAHLSPIQVAEEEDYWTMIQQAYTVNPNIINLNNGGVSPAPKIVQEAVERYNKLSNEGPSYFMWRILDMGREPLRQKLALLAGSTDDEIAINRNSTEALNTIIYGLPLQKGDEVIGCLQDYPNMIQAWKQRALRDGIN